MALKDLPAVIDFITETTGQQQIYYAGHSQGTMMAFAGFSRNQSLAKRIKKVYALAPVAFLGSIKSPMKYLSIIVPEVKVRICYLSLNFL